MNKYSPKIIACLLIFLVANNALSMCPLAEWHISGKVVSFRTMLPIEGAQVLVFLDENESTYSAGYFTKYPDFFYTDEAGRFEAISHINTSQMRFIIIGEVCVRKPKKVEVVVIKEGFRTRRMVFSRSEFVAFEPAEIGRIVLPDIALMEPMKVE
jgi:hypothetical protein